MGYDLMDVSEVIDSLDSLWFYSNNLSPIAQILTSSGNWGTPKFNLKQLSKSKPSEPNIPIPAQEQKHNSPNAHILVQSCPRCVELAAEIHPIMAKTEPIKVKEPPPKTPQKEETRRKSRSKATGLDKRGRIVAVGEVDFGELVFDVNINKVFGAWKIEGTSGSQKYFGSPIDMKMPPLNDGTAMKQHLKSWAYAVACTVR